MFSYIRSIRPPFPTLRSLFQYLDHNIYINIHCFLLLFFHPQMSRLWREPGNFMTFIVQRGKNLFASTSSFCSYSFSFYYKKLIDCFELLFLETEKPKFFRWTIVQCIVFRCCRRRKSFHNFTIRTMKWAILNQNNDLLDITYIPHI